MKLPQEHFALQLCFAARVAQVLRLPLDEALFHHSTLPLSLELEHPLVATDPVWQDYCAGLARSADPVAWTDQVYQTRYQPFVADFFGCFCYSYFPDAGRVRLHFHNNETDGHGALAKERLGLRRAELTALFADVARHHPEATTVRGGSWLYNLDAYRRLFPPPYSATAYPIDEGFRYMALWGQFFDRHGQVKPMLATAFLTCIEQHTTIEALRHCFPFQTLRVECAIEHFYTFYGITPPADRAT